MSGSILSRSLLTKAFPNNPRIRAELENLATFLSETNDRAGRARELIDGVLDDLGDGGKFQKAGAILDAISDLPDRVGTIEITSGGQAVVRPIDSEDPASLLTRGVAYTVLVGIAGKGTTAQRPALPATTVGVYLDTTLAAPGRPIFWTGAAWVDADGNAV